MSRLHVRTRGPSDWRASLASPEKHWRRGWSAFEAAVSWESAQKGEKGLPAPIAALLAQEDAFKDAKLLLGVVEHKVALPHGIRASQNDVWGLVCVRGGLLSLAVEAKAGEDFDATVEEWLEKKERGSKKPDRLRYLLHVLGVSEADVRKLRYQLLHRTASAVVEAERFGCEHAAMVVQAFKNPARRFDRDQQVRDFESVADLLGAKATDGVLARARHRSGAGLYLGWASCDPASDRECTGLLSRNPLSN